MNVGESVHFKSLLTFRTPTIVVVRAVLYAVHKTVEYMRMKPITQDKKNVERNIISSHFVNANV